MGHPPPPLHLFSKAAIDVMEADPEKLVEEWGWSPDYDLGAMVADMLENLGRKVKRAG